MQYLVSRAIVQRLCDDRADLVPYLSRIVDSLESNGGLYQAKLAEVLPPDVIDELHQWLIQLAQTNQSQPVPPSSGTGPMAADLSCLARIFSAPDDGLAGRRLD